MTGFEFTRIKKLIYLKNPGQYNIVHDKYIHGI